VRERLGPAGDRAFAAVDDLGPGREELPARYRGATVTVLPSVHEAFGIVLVESLASGTPVVCSDDGGMVEIVDRPAIGRVAPPRDPDRLAAAVIEAIDLANEPATPPACAEHARRWDWATAVGPAHEEVYARTVSGPRRARR
jgi:glycosyltransferase involved in cell wall biosynthesis